jgi:Sulfotransferase family
VENAAGQRGPCRIDHCSFIARVCGKTTAVDEHSSLGRARPILVVGAPRTGSTWIAEALSHAPGLCWINEPDNGRVTPFALKAKLPLGEYPILRPGESAPADYRRLWTDAFGGRHQGRTPREVASTTLLRRIDATGRWEALCAPHPRVRLRVRATARLARPPSAPSAAERVMVKSVHAALSSEWLAALTDPEVVVVVRHPLNVVASWMDLGYEACAIHRPAVRHWYMERLGIEEPLLQSSRLARVAWEVGLLLFALHEAAGEHPEWTPASHDALCRDPVGSFRTLTSRLGLTWSADIEDYLDRSNRHGSAPYGRLRVTGEQPDRWRVRLTLDQQREAGAILERFGLSLGDK